jgi:hypothetical protein
VGAARGSPGGSDRRKGRTRRIDARIQALAGRRKSSWDKRSALARASSAANQLQSMSSLEQLQCCHILYIVKLQATHSSEVSTAFKPNRAAFRAHGFETYMQRIWLN